MKINFFTSIVLVFLFFICISTECRKELPPPKYNFIEKLNLFPDKKLYHIGDTIWIQYINTTKTLFDATSNQNIPADTIGIPFGIALNSRYKTPVDPPDGFCDFVSTNGMNINRNLSTYGTSTNQGFGCNSNNDISFRIGVILKKTGIYSLDLAQPILSNFSCSNRLTPFPLSVISYQYSLADCNKDIYLSIPANSRGESIKGYTENEIDKKHIFILEVQ